MIKLAERNYWCETHARDCSDYYLGTNEVSGRRTRYLAALIGFDLPPKLTDWCHMKNPRIYKSCFLVSAVVIFSCVNMFAQAAKPLRPGLILIKPATQLVDEFGRTTPADKSGRLDSLFSVMSKNANSKGYVYVYCGKICPSGEIEAHFRGIESFIWIRKFDRKRLVVLNGGFRDSTTVELWLVPEGACPPAPRPSVEFRHVSFIGKYKNRFESYDCCKDDDFQWEQP